MKLKSYLPIALIAGLSLASCQEDTENFDNKVFSPTVNPVSNILVKEGTTAETGYVQAHMSKNESFDVNVTFGDIADKVADYNSIYNQEAELLPQGFYEIPEPTATITAGMVQTPRVPVNFINLETLDVSKLYVLPVGIVSAPFDHMSNYLTYFVVREASIINVVANMTKTAATFMPPSLRLRSCRAWRKSQWRLFFIPRHSPTCLPLSWARRVTSSCVWATPDLIPTRYRSQPPTATSQIPHGNWM